MLRHDRNEEEYIAATRDILKEIGLYDRKDHLPSELSGTTAAGGDRPCHGEQT